MNFLTVILLVFGTLMFIAVMAVAIFFAYSRIKEQDEPDNAPLIENYMPQYAEGHTEGIVKSLQIGENLIKITFIPRDINYVKEKNQKTSSKGEYTIFYDRKFVDFDAEGEFSMHRAKIKAYPHKVSLLPESIKKNHPEIAEKISQRIENKEEARLMEKRMLNLKKVAEKDFGGEIFTSFADMATEILKDKGDLVRKPDEQKFRDLGSKK